MPDNYLHVTINEAAIDSFNGGANYDDVITRAADEAGGHAFATDFSGSTAPFRGLLWSEGRYNLDALQGITDPEAYVQALIGQGFPGSAAMLTFLIENVLEPAAAISAGIDPQSYDNCMSCYAQYGADPSFDPVAATEALQTDIEMLLDWRANAAAAFNDFSGTGCGCASGDAFWTAPSALIALALIRRRRR